MIKKMTERFGHFWQRGNREPAVGRGAEERGGRGARRRQRSRGAEGPPIEQAKQLLIINYQLSIINYQ